MNTINAQQPVKRRTAQKQAQHDALVVSAAEFLLAKNFENVHADAPGFTPPTRITWRSTGEGHVPDLTADGKIFEVETEDSIGIEHTASQWKLFSAHAKAINAEFWVIVPVGCATTAKSRLTTLELTGKVWEL